MEIIKFPTPRRTGLNVEVFDDNGEANIIHHFDITCPNCGHLNSFDTGQTAIMRRVEFFCGNCNKAIAVSNPGIKSKQVPKK